MRLAFRLGHPGKHHSRLSNQECVIFCHGKLIWVGASVALVYGNLKTFLYLLRVLELWWRHVPYSPHCLQRGLVEERGFPVNHFHDHNACAKQK